MNQEWIREIKENTVFQISGKTPVTYSFGEPEYAALIEQYHLAEIAGTGDLEKSLHMLSWVNSHIRHKGNYDNSDTQDALTLLGAAFDKNYGINCLAMSIVLFECLLALRVRARVMYMMPKNAQDGDNHVVVEAYVPDRNKWIMLDPTYGSYCLNSEGEILNLYEIRNCIAQDTEYYFSASMNYNGNPVDDMDEIKTYYAKNLFFFRCKSIQGYGQHRNYGNILEIAPSGFDVHKRMTDNLRFRIDVCGDLEIFHTWMQYEENLGNVYIDPLSIY